MPDLQVTSFAANRRQTDADTPGILSLFRKSLAVAAAAVIAHINPLPSLRPPRSRPLRLSFRTATQLCTLPFSPKFPDVCEQSHPPRLDVSFFSVGTCAQVSATTRRPHQPAVSKVAAVPHHVYSDYGDGGGGDDDGDHCGSRGELQRTLRRGGGGGRVGVGCGGSGLNDRARRFVI